MPGPTSINGITLLGTQGVNYCRSNPFVFQEVLTQVLLGPYSFMLPSRHQSADPKPGIFILSSSSAAS